MLLNSDFLKKIRRIQITTSRMVTDVFAGQYHSVFKGRGIEFDEVREYQPGDEIRSIDWNVTARMGHPYVKKFVEERELTVMILLDVSSSTFFGSVKALKSRLAAELSAILSLSAVKNNDKVGLLAFSNKTEKFLPPKKGTGYILRIIRDALYYSSPDASKNLRQKTDLTEALNTLNKIVKRRAVVFIISDFYDFKENAAETPEEFNFKKQLAASAKHHDVIAITLTDPRELDLPDIGLIRFEDAETGKGFLIDSSNTKVKAKHKEKTQKIINARRALFRSLRVDHIDIQTSVPYSKALIKFFKERGRRFR